MCPFSACSQFKEISFAYEVLSDAEKRQVYDRHGEERLKEGGGGGPGFGSAEDLFSSIFGGGFFGTRSASTRHLHQKAFLPEPSIVALHGYGRGLLAPETWASTC